MARRRLLTREALAPHYDPPTEEREIARYFTLSREDLDLVRTAEQYSTTVAAG